MRELENVVERAVILTPGDTLAFDEHFLRTEPEASGAASQSLEEVERAHILRVIDECGGRIAGRGNAAERLGLNRSTLRSRMERLGIARGRDGGRAARD